MASPEPRPCPHCGSADTKMFPDGSGSCSACGLAFRGPGTTGTLLAGEQVEVRKTAVVRATIRLGLLGLVGGLLGFLAIPLVFVIGAALAGVPASQYTSDVINRPTAALTCAGTVLLTISAYYSLWAGYVVWRGYPERGIHLLVAGTLVAVASLLAGQGLPGAVGILGGVLALVAGLIVWRAHRAAERKEDEGASEPA